MTTLTSLGRYRDDADNVIDSPPLEAKQVSITFNGSGNRVIIDKRSRIERLTVTFHGNHGTVRLGHNRNHGRPRLNLRLGAGSSITFGDDLTTTTPLFASAVEGAGITVGNDVMCATHIQLRTDDSHAIYDVDSGERINPAQSITIGDHVWLGYEAVVLGGVTIASGSVLGIRSVATADIPNNVIAVGAPARVVRRNIAWERPFLWLSDRPDPWPQYDSGRLPAHWKPTDADR